MADPTNDGWAQIVDGIDEAGLPSAQNPPAASPNNTFALESVGGGEPQVIPQVPAAPANPNTLQGSLEGFVDSMQEPQLPSYLSVLGHGLERGVNQIRAAVPTWQGIASEIAGNDQAAAQYAAEANAINKEAGPQQISGVFDDNMNLNIRSWQDLTYWAAERFGEQAPILLAMMASGGAGAGIGAMVGRGALSATRAAELGAFTGNTLLEGAGTGQEQYDATGKYNPEVTLPAALIKARLETYTPFKFLQEIKGMSVLGAAGRAAGREAITEGLQEQVDILARKYSDPNYSYFSSGMVSRTLESALTGGLVGAGFAGPAQALHNASAKPTDRILTGEEIDQFPEPPPPIPETSLAPGVLSTLRQGVQGQETASPDVGPEARIPAQHDVVETGVVDQTTMADWQAQLQRSLALENVLNIEDDNVPRYVTRAPDGSLGTRLLNSTDLEEHHALQGNLPTEPDSYRVDMNSLQPGAITADVWDLPQGENERVWFLPGTSPSEKQAMLADYAQAYLDIQKLREQRFQNPEVRAQAEERYAQLLDRGLRVLPSRGASFSYNGDVETSLEPETPKSARGVQSFVTAGDVAVGKTIFPAQDRDADAAYTAGHFKTALALDFNQIPEDAYTVNEDGSVTITKQIPENAITYGYAVSPRIQPKTNQDFQTKGGKAHRMPSVGESPAAKARAERAMQWWKEFSPWLIDLQKRLGMTNFVSLIISDNKTMAAYPNLVLGYRAAGNTIYYNTYFTIPSLKPSLDTKEGFLLGMLHEIGHAVAGFAWNKLDARAQAKVFEGWKRALLNSRITGRTESVNTALLVGDEVAPVLKYYYLSFNEWLAEQFRRWGTSEAIAMSSSEAFYKSVGRKLEGLYNGFVEKIGAEKAFELFIPDYSIETWFQWLQNQQNPDISPAKLSAQARVTNMDIEVPDDMLPTLSQVQAALEAWGHLVPADVGVELSNEDPFGAELASGAIEVNQGIFLRNQRLIKLFLAGIAYMETPSGASTLLIHEGFHTIEEYLTPQERALLIREGMRLKVMSQEQIGIYMRHYRNELRALGLDPDQHQALIKSWIENEVMAHLVEGRWRSADFSQELNTILDRILELFKRIAEIVRGNGWQSVDDVLRAFYRGDITERRNEEEPPYTLAELTDVGEPVVQSMQEMYNNYLEFMAKHGEGEPKSRDAFEIEVLKKWLYDVKTRNKKATPSEQDKAFQRRIQRRLAELTKNVGEPALAIGQPRGPVNPKTSIGGRQYEVIKQGAEEQHFAFYQDGRQAGFVTLSLEPGLGWDVSFIKNQRPGKETRGLVDDMLKTVQRDIGAELQASGTLTQAGYNMLKRLAPQQIAYHVHFAREGIWYSPRQLQVQISIKQRELEDIKNNRFNWTPEYKRMVEGDLSSLRELQRKIPAGYFQDPNNVKRFSKAVAKRKGYENTLAQEQARSDEELIAAVQGGQPEQNPLLTAMQQKNEGETPELQGMARIFDRIFVGEKNPEVRAKLHGILDAGDAISRMSKWYYSLQQLAWRNKHISGLQDYLGYMEQYNTRRMQWIARADETARAWDKLQPDKQREHISDMMFWLTEMEYRTPAEKRAGTVRHPTPQEVAAEAQRLGMTPQAMQLLDTIRKDFDDYLTDLENITVANIQRRAANSPNARVLAQQQVAEVRADMAQLRAKPYFPMVRFGQFFITVRNQFVGGGKAPVEFFALYATERERDAAVRQVAAQYPGYQLQIGLVPENVHEFMGLPATLLKQIASKLPGISPAQLDWLEQFQNMQAPERSFRKRFLRRKGTPGYSLDGIRVYAHYFRSGANYLARIEYKDLLEDKVKEVDISRATLGDSKKRTMILNYMREHLDYVMKGGNDWAKLKAIVSVYQLGYSVAASGMNLTQTFIVTWPYLGTIYGNAKAGKYLMQIMQATKQTFGKPPPGASIGFLKAREEMVAQGKIDVGQAPELGGYAEGSNLTKMTAGTKVQRAWRAFSYWGMWLFQHTEQFNRELTFNAAYHLAMQDPNNPHLVGLNGVAVYKIPEILDLQTRLGLTQQEAIATIAAREALDRTQFIYQPWARPKFLQNPGMSSLLVFFQFTQNMLYALRFNPGKEKMLFFLLALYGLSGLPGADDVDKFIKWFSRRFFEKNFSPLEYAREQMHQLTQGTIFDTVGPDILLHGISRYSFGVGFLPEGWGVPRFDASANGSMGNIIPGLAPALEVSARGGNWKELTSQVAQDVAGAGFGQMFAWMQFMDSQPMTGDAKKWERIMPRAAKAWSKAYRFYTEGGDIDPNTGAPFVKFDATNPDDIVTILAQAVGFTPTELSKKWEALRVARDLGQWYEYRKLTLMVQYDAALRAKDREAVSDVRRAIQAYNKEVQDAKLPALSITVDTLSKSMMARARLRAQRTNDIAPSPGQQQIQNKTFENYGIIHEKKVR